VVAVYAKRVTLFDVEFATHTYIWPLKGRKYCIKWGEFKWYGDPDWRTEYERVQAKRVDLLRRWLNELEGKEEKAEPEGPVEKVVRWIVERSYETLKRAGITATDPADAVAKAVAGFDNTPYEGRMSVSFDSFRLYGGLIREVGDTTFHNFARMVNETLGREAAKVARDKRGFRVEIKQEDFLELVKNLASPKKRTSN